MLRRTVLLALTGVLLAPAVSADPPEWLRALARETLPSYKPETNAVQLLDEQVTTISDSGEIHTTYRRAYKILRPDGRSYGSVAVYFDSETKLTYLKGWSIPPDGKPFEVKEKDALEVNLSGGGILYDDTRTKVLRIPAAEPGNIVGYEYEQKRRSATLQDVWFFQDRIPVRHARYSLQIPKSWEFKTVWVNHADVKPVELVSNSWSWELQDLPEVEREPAMPPWRAIAGWLAVSFVPSDQALRQKSIASWEALGAWYSQVAAGRRSPSPEMKQKVAELTAGKSNVLEKISAITAFVQRDIRYVAILIGIGAYQPHAAQEIFQNRYGDCKDKVTLLSTMLAEIGVPSYYVLVHSDRGFTVREFPSMYSFNHVILAFVLPKDTQAPQFFSYFDHPRLGRLVLFDPTDTSTPLGYLPSSLQASRGLLVTENSGELLDLPLLPPATNRLLRTGKLTLASNGTLSGDVQEIRWGSTAVERRATLLSAPGTERMKIMESILGGWLSSGFVLRSAAADNLENHNEGLVLRYQFDAPQYAKMAGPLMMVRPRVLGVKGDDIMERKVRKYPVEFPEARLDTDEYEITLPPGFKPDELPPPVEMDIGIANYKSKIEVNGNVMRYSRQFTIKDVRVPAQKLEELKKFYRMIAADERNTAVLTRPQ